MPYLCRIPHIVTVKDLHDILHAEGAGTQEIESCVDSLFTAYVLIEGLSKGVRESIHTYFDTRGRHTVILPGRMGTEYTEILLSGNISQFEQLCDARTGILDQDEEITRNLRKVLEGLRNPYIPPIVYNGKYLDFSKKTYIMGILNVTPDSFSDGGRFLHPKRAVAHALQMAEEGADILDIGGESTRPGSEPVPAHIQIERILPVIKEIREHLNIWISVDTYRSEVARAAIEAGADMVNDISGAQFDREMPSLVAETGIPLVMMHIRGTPRDMQISPTYRSLLSELLGYFEERIDAVEQAGVSREKVILDPGIGFGKTVEHNLSILKHLTEFSVLGRPLLVGTSRKSFIGSILNRGMDKRLWGSLATVVVAYWNGAHIVRAHDVAETKEALLMAEAIKRVEFVP